MRSAILLAATAVLFSHLEAAAAELPLSEQALLDRETFWDNRDWDWYRANIPFFECPNSDIQTTWYYRWELVTKHLTYGSPDSGYSFTEFIDRPFWSGAYGAISCPAGHQLYEVRWLRDPQFSRDYARYWFRTPGAQPRRYSTWLADAVWAVHRVHPDRPFAVGLLPDLKANYEGWEERHFVPEVGLFWQTGHDDGMEFNINSRQTEDIVRGAPGFRPSLNAYLWADALAIARIANLAGDPATAEAYRTKAAGLKEILLTRLWDEKRQFFFPLSQRDETAEGHMVKALTLTHQSGRHAGSPYGRELIGYIPWQFGLPDAGRGYEPAWRKLIDPEAFAAPFGPTTVERRDPMFHLSETCCWWSGHSWPYATSQTLKALANVLQGVDQNAVSRADYLRLLDTFARTHRKDGRPYLAEACHPDTGSFAGHDGYNHSEHYFHSSYCDLVITGLVGLVPRDDDRLELRPLAPSDWPYFALANVPYRGLTLAIYWDKDGSRYGLGQGLTVLADGQPIARSPGLGALSVELPAARPSPEAAHSPVNFVVNNDGTYYPRISASFTGPGTSASRLVDGNYWYHLHPPNRWTSEGSPNGEDETAVDFGMPRSIHTIKLYFLDDGAKVVPPDQVVLEHWDSNEWRAIPQVSVTPDRPAGRRANVYRFPLMECRKVRARFRHAAGGRTGLTEIEAWGPSRRPVVPAPHPEGNLAYNPGGQPFPKASASFMDRFGGAPELAHDGKTNFLANPVNRWTAYESPHDSDWIAIDLGREAEVSRVELAIYDDRSGVQPPLRYEVETWNEGQWQPVSDVQMNPAQPAGGQFNEARFRRVKTSKVRIVFHHAGKSRSGVSEVMVWGGE
jgi:hypothetical protein